MSRQSTERLDAQTRVRRENLSSILYKLFEEQPLSRAALAEATDLNKSTVSSLVEELIGKDFVCETGWTSGSVGRPSMQLELNPEAGTIVSCDLGVDFISVICTDFTGQSIWQDEVRPHPSPEQEDILANTIRLLGRAIDAGARHNPAYPNPLGIALGVPGLVEEASGNLLLAPNLDWREVPIKARLARAFPGKNIYVDNEGNLAALGEDLLGAARDHNVVLYISAGVGLGGAIVREGKLARGAAGYAGEFGHMTIDPSPTAVRCHCGNTGCWETLVSQRAVFRHIKEAIEQKRRPSQLSEMTGGDLDALTVKLVVEAARAGDAVARNALDTVGHDLGIGLASLINAFNPDLVVFGGILSLAWDEFLQEPVRAEIGRRALRWNRETTDVVRSKHGLDATLMGGVAQVIQAVLNDPVWFRNHT
jgi:glucokinase-like ROK family protein